MTDTPMVALIAVYPNRAYADAAVDHFLATGQTKPLDVAEIAVVTKDADSKVTAEEVGRSGARHGAKRGALAGAVVGMLFPPGLLVATAAGAGTGGAIGHRQSGAYPRSRLEWIGAEISRGHTGVIVVVADAESSDAAGRLLGYKQFYRVPLDVVAPSSESAIRLDTAPT